MEQELYAAKPDTIVIISPHGVVLLDAFLINLADRYHSDFGQFGDFSTSLEFKPNLSLIEGLRMQAQAADTILTVASEPKLDHGATVPLYYLTKHLQDVSLVPISYSLLDFATHIKFGEILKDEIYKTNDRVALIASGDLAHKLNKDSPAGYDPQAKVFDEKLIELLKNKDLEGILKLDHALIEAAGECGLRSILILLGVIKNTNYTPEVLSYESPFGVGYLTVQFHLQ